MSRTVKPPANDSVALPADSAAFALLHAAQAVAAVRAGRNLDEFINSLFYSHFFPEAARGAVQDLAFGTLRDFGRGEFLLGKLLARPVPEPLIHALLLVAVYRLETREAVAHTTVDQAVRAAQTVARGNFKALVNGVLRNFQRQRAALLAAADADPVAHLRHPAWWIAAIRQVAARYATPVAAEAALAAGNLHPPMCLRVNRRRVTAAAQLAALEAAGIGAHAINAVAGHATPEAILLDAPMPVTRIPGFAQGHVSVQDAGAQVAAHLMDLAPGLRVLDACAAPGGKSAHMLELADIDLTALEIDPVRARRIDENLARLGLAATVKVADSADPAAWWDGRAYDRVLADVPCSASGVARRHPDIKWLRREADLARFARGQQRILDALWQVLAPGGRMLVATCSLFEQENQRQIAAFQERHPDCIRQPLAGDPLLLPTALHDGFHYALLAKRG